MTDIRRAAGLYSASDICRQINYDRQKFWRGIRDGFIFRPKHGKGRRKYYSAADAERIAKLLGRKLPPELDN